VFAPMSYDLFGPVDFCKQFADFSIAPHWIIDFNKSTVIYRIQKFIIATYLQILFTCTFFRYLVTFLVLIIVYLFSFSECIIYSCIVYWRWYSLYTKCIIRNTSYLYLHAFFSIFNTCFFSFHLKTDDWYSDTHLLVYFR
jgi:hypothetical protein